MKLWIDDVRPAPDGIPILLSYLSFVLLIIGDWVKLS